MSEKEYLRNHYGDIVKPIVIRYEGSYLSLLSNNNESLGISDDENVEINIGNYANFDVCCVLNTMVWPTLQESSKDDQSLLLQLKFRYLFAKSNNMKVYNPVSIDLLINDCSDIVQYAYRYFNIAHTVPMKLWSKLLIIHKNNEHLKDIILLLELCLYTTFSNTTLERFSHLKVVTTQFRSKLLAGSLNSIMRKKVKGVSLEELNRDYARKCADFWYSSRARRLDQSKRKEYAERKSNKRKRVQLNINELTSESSSCSSKEECSVQYDNNNALFIF